MNLDNNVYKPISFWSWNGDMRENEIRWQINQFKEQGFGGFFIHSRAGRLIPYMGDDWFGACANAIDEAQKVGLDVWLYDEDGWPSGFAGGIVNGCGEAYCAKLLRFSVGMPSDKSARILAVYRENSEGGYCRISENEGTEKDLYCFYLVVPHYVDIMDRATIAKFIEVTHEEYKKHLGQYFGNVIKGIFTDEPQIPAGPCWSMSLEQKYYEKYKEDIFEQLWLLQMDGQGCEKFRYRFWLCVNEMVRENYACQINDWCNENQLIFTGHFSSEDGLNEQMFTSGGVMPFYKHMGMPGIDHLGNRFASSVLMKQVTSVAHREGISHVLSESFGCAGWDISFKELLGIAGWQAVFGVNRLCTHLSAYTMTGRRKRDYPAFFSYQEPWWKETHTLFHAIEKLNSVLGTSTRDTKVAVLHPIRSVWCMNRIEERNKARFLTAQFRELVENLLDIQVDFDLIDEGELGEATVVDEKIQSGKVGYSMVIIPESFTLSKDSAEKLIEFSENGGKVLFMNGRPLSVEGDYNDPLVEKVQRINAIEIQNTRNFLQKYFRVFPIQDDFRIFDERLGNDITGLVSHYGKTAEGAVIYLFNKNREHDIRAILRYSGSCRFEIISLIDDGKTNITKSYDGSYTYAPLTVEGGTGVLLKVTYVEKSENIVTPELQTYPLTIHTVNPVEDNALTLDWGRFRINDGEWSSYKAVIHMLDEIYASIAECTEDAKVSVEYTFHADFQKMPKHLALAVEKMDSLDITLNSQPVTKEVTWWVDKGIIKYDISGMVKNGTNKVLLDYIIPITGQVNDLSGKFESERNRFFYNIEPESVYVCGDFDVKCKEPAVDNLTHYWIKNKDKNSEIFSIVDATEKSKGELTKQGMWFYRGDCEYSGDLLYDGKNEILVGSNFVKCVAAKVLVNGKEAGVLVCTNDTVNITQHLDIGNNTITVVALGHNRNLLGPHHHIKGATYFVGQHIYAGVCEFEDFVNPEIQTSSTWTDDYSFVPFGIKEVTIISLKK